MGKHYTNLWVKALFAVVLVFGLGAAFYIFGKETKTIFGESTISTNKKDDIGVLNKTALVQKNLLDSLETLKLAYDVAMLEKTSLSQELEFEKKNVENLMEIIRASRNPSFSQIQIYRKQLSDLKISLASKIAEIKNLKSENKSLLSEIENQNEVMYQQKIKNDTLTSHQKKLESTLKSASKLDLNNFKVVALREKKSGEELETDKAKTTNILKASFSISGNSVAKTGKRVFYVQVLDQKNTVLGEDKLIEFGNNKALVYSFIVSVDFQGKPVNVYGVLSSYGYEFQKGTYFVNFFDKQEMLGSTSITLK